MTTVSHVAIYFRNDFSCMCGHDGGFCGPQSVLLKLADQKPHVVINKSSFSLTFRPDNEAVICELIVLSEVNQLNISLSC